MHRNRITRQPVPPVALEDRGAHNRFMGSDTANVVLLFLAWVAFAALHSSLAPLGLKRVKGWRKPLARFGAAYQGYMAQVPGLLPLPWRNLSREEARRLEGRR